jgi:DNA-binding GntR family transcriptional regulator
MPVKSIGLEQHAAHRSAKKAQSTSLANEIFRDVRRDIIECQLTPGEKLRMDSIAERYGVSLSSVREALSRLSAEGLVVSQPQRGFWVAPVAINDLRDITRARIEIESICVRWSIENANSAWRAELTDTHERLACLDPLDPTTMTVTSEWEAQHQAFHEVLVSRGPNETLKLFRRQLFEKAERYRRLAGRVVQRERNVAEEHRLIYRAAMKGDGLLTAALLASHIRETAENLEDAPAMTGSEGASSAT